jgi:two-component system nitrogen regulation response regulator GlnG
VLITGESGTGKELVAQALHKHSARKAKPFVALNTAAIPKDLLESELFGHERGAFTGAAATRKGRFEQAQGGTLFLDEIGDMPAELQTRLLRVLAEGQFYRVGGTSAVTVDVRVIAATHQALEARVEAGLFREDLFHRLNVIRLRLPALRERVEDIALLAQHFLDKSAKQLSVEVKQLLPDAVLRMQAFGWSGNVRQLENVCQWLTVMAASQHIGVQDLPPELNASPKASAPLAPTVKSPSPVGVTLPYVVPTALDGVHWSQLVYADTLARLQAGENNVIDALYEQLETVCIQAALNHTQGHKSEAAMRLGLGRNTLARKAKK